MTVHEAAAERARQGYGESCPCSVCIAKRDVLALSAALSAAQEREKALRQTLRYIAYVPGGNEYDGIRSAARAALAPADTETP